jgi:hypothetical protein
LSSLLSVQMGGPAWVRATLRDLGARHRCRTDKSVRSWRRHPEPLRKLWHGLSHGCPHGRGSNPQPNI